MWNGKQSRGRERWAFDERILGSDQFVRQVRDREVEGPRMVARLEGTQAAVLLPRLIRTVASIWKVDPEEVCSSGKQRALVAARAVVSFTAVREGGMSLVTVSRELKVSSCTVMRGVRVGQRIAEKHGLKAEDLLRECAARAA